MNITTSQDNTGYATKDCLWSAIDADSYEGGMPIGFGATQEEAVADLLEQLS